MNIEVIISFLLNLNKVASRLNLLTETIIHRLGSGKDRATHPIHDNPPHLGTCTADSPTHISVMLHVYLDRPTLYREYDEFYCCSNPLRQVHENL